MQGWCIGGEPLHARLVYTMVGNLQIQVLKVKPISIRMTNIDLAFVVVPTETNNIDLHIVDQYTPLRHKTQRIITELKTPR